MLINEIRKARLPLADRWLYRWGIWFLGATVIAIILLAFFFLSEGKDVKISEGLLALGSAAIGALACLISPRHGDNGDN